MKNIGKGKLWRCVSLCVALLAFGVFASAAPTVHARALATETVTDCTDETGLETAITDAGAGDTIDFECSGTIPIGNGTIAIDKNLTIDASTSSGVTFDLSASADARLEVEANVSFTLKKLTLSNGGDAALVNKGGNLTITDCTFSGNKNVLGGVGGAILNVSNGTVTIANSLFSNNSVAPSFTSQGQGGAIFNQSGRVSITASTFSGNKGAAFGGAIYNYDTLVVTTSTFASNQTSGGGGSAIFQGDYAKQGPPFHPNASATITNSTFVNNQDSQSGAAINTTSGTLTLSNSTLSGNTPSGISNNKVQDNQTTTNLSASILANPTNCVGIIASKGYNLETGSSCGFTQVTDQQNTDPRLGPLVDNGGPTQTMALQAGSPAINQIPLLGPGCDTVTNTKDQRGEPRPGTILGTGLPGVLCDKGAYETQDKVL